MSVATIKNIGGGYEQPLDIGYTRLVVYGGGNTYSMIPCYKFKEIGLDESIVAGATTSYNYYFTLKDNTSTSVSTISVGTSEVKISIPNNAVSFNISAVPSAIKGVGIKYYK